ncbi:MAG: ribonuclease E/G [Parvibaculales bacterium]
MDKAKNELIIMSENGLVKAARVDDGTVVDIAVEPVSGDNSASGQILLGHVERVVPHLQAAFVDIGEDKAGFLGAREARVLAEEPSRETEIDECVAAGDTVLVQVIRPASGDKGAGITANVTLPGRHLVLAPCSNRIAVSRSIEDEAERARLTELAENARTRLNIEGLDGPAGWVLRTAAEGVGEETLVQDMETVAQRWDEILDLADGNEAPFVLHRDLGGLEKILRDHVTSETAAIIIGDADLAAQAQGYMATHMAGKEGLLQVSDGEDVFERHDIHGVIQQACEARVDLPSGAWLMIETTQAMTTIDVNSGSQNDAAEEVNRLAASEIARQIRLRAVGGLIAVDFIDMSPDTDTAPIMDALHAGFDGDKAPVRIGELSDFGVVEMTRKRDRLPLQKALRGSHGG